MDSNKLSHEQMSQMLIFLPTVEEIALLANVPDQDKSNLGKPEQNLSFILTQFS
jgi:hypothetical protein